MFAFWSEYLNMVSILLDFIEAERDSNWKEHPEACRNMLPYDHSFDHFKYLTWGLVYLCDTDQLAVKYPDVYDNFMMGKHVKSTIWVRDITELSGYPRSNVKTRLEQSNYYLASGRFPLQNAIYDNKLPFSRMWHSQQT